MLTIDTGSGFAPRTEPGDGSGFAKHRIKHLSASSLNLWKNAPDVWVAKYLGGMKSAFGPAPVRGQRVEDVVATVLKGGDFTKAVADALDRFDRTFPNADEAARKERGMIADMAKLAIDELRDLGPLEWGDDQDSQCRVSIKCNFGEWSIPVIGFLDFVFPDSGTVIDLKTTSRIPSSMSSDHRLQRAIYARAKGNFAVKFLYVSTKKTALLEDGDVAETLAQAKHAVARLERFLAHHDAQSAIQCVPHNPDSFFWRGDEAARHQFFGT